MKVLLLGIGNILFGDEGIGAHLAHLFAKNYRFHSKEHVLEIVDGGTLAQFLIPTITSADSVILLDCVNVGEDGKEGDVYAFDFDKIPLHITWQGSAHEVEMLQTLQMTAINGDLPPVHIIGIVPHVIGHAMTFELSNACIEGAKTMEKLVLRRLHDLGFEATQIDTQSLQSLAHTTFRGF